ncbi:MAG: outer membrane beta-barrel protein [Rhodothermales bacterium]
MKGRSLQVVFSIAFLVSCLLSVRPAQAQFARFGVTAGLNFDRLSDVVLNSVDANFESSTGWHLEVWADLPLGPVAVRPGLRYMDAGHLFQGLSDVSSGVREDFDINLVEVPIAARFRFSTPAVKPYVFAGPVLRFPVGVSDDLDGDLESPSVAGELGLGVEVSLGVVTLYPEISFTFGISRFVADEFTIGFEDFSTDDRQHLNTAMLRLGIGL